MDFPANPLRQLERMAPTLSPYAIVCSFCSYCTLTTLTNIVSAVRLLATPSGDLALVYGTGSVYLPMQ